MQEILDRLRKSYPENPVYPIGELNPDASYELRGFMVPITGTQFASYDEDGNFLGDGASEYHALGFISGATHRRRFRPLSAEALERVVDFQNRLKEESAAQKRVHEDLVSLGLSSPRE